MFKISWVVFCLVLSGCHLLNVGKGAFGNDAEPPGRGTIIIDNRTSVDICEFQGAGSTSMLNAERVAAGTVQSFPKESHSEERDAFAQEVAVKGCGGEELGLLEEQKLWGDIRVIAYEGTAPAVSPGKERIVMIPVTIPDPKDRLPVIGMSDPALESEMLRILNTTSDTNHWKAVAIRSKEWVTVRHPNTGIVLGRQLEVRAARTDDTDGRCWLSNVIFEQEHNGTTFSETIFKSGIGIIGAYPCKTVELWLEEMPHLKSGAATTGK